MTNCRSNCCDTPMNPDLNICPSCKEHCVVFADGEGMHFVKVNNQVYVLTDDAKKTLKNIEEILINK